MTDEEGGELYEEKSVNNIKGLYMKDGFLTEFIIIGNVERAGIYTSLIRYKVPLDNINIDLLKKIRLYQYFFQKNVEKN